MKIEKWDKFSTVHLWQLFCDDCSNSDSKELQTEDGVLSDSNEDLKQTLDDLVCKVQPRTNALFGFLQNLGFDPDAFSWYVTI